MKYITKQYLVLAAILVAKVLLFAWLLAPLSAHRWHEPFPSLGERLVYGCVMALVVTFVLIIFRIREKTIVEDIRRHVFHTALFTFYMAVVLPLAHNHTPVSNLAESMPSIECKCDIRVEPLQYFNPKIHRFLESDSAGTTIIIDTHASKDYRDLILDPADTIWSC